MKKIQFLLGIIALVSMTFAVPWPAGAGVAIHQNLPAGYEPSGVVWHPHYNSLFLVSDSGTLSKMNPDGSQVSNWRVAGDLEGITIADPQSEFVYVAVEHPFAIIKFNPTTGQIVRTISLVGIIPAVANTNSGIEALTFVPNGFHPYANSANGGLFYIGVQENGVIRVVDVDFNAGTARLVASVTPVAGRTDLAGLHFSTETETLYVEYDAANLLREITVDNVLIREYTLAGLDQEGVTLMPGCPQATTTIFIAEDSGRVMKYEQYPITCAGVPEVDADNDGFARDVDCNDNNAAINPAAPEVLYDGLDNDCNPVTQDTRDADSDGFASNVDCNDGNAQIHPGRNEVIGNGVDDDCNPLTLDVLPVALWPADAGVDIHQNLPAGYEPSGVAWHPYHNALFTVSDNGAISRMNLDGSGLATWNVAGDLEGITAAEPGSEFVYVAVEFPYAVIKFNPIVGQVVRSVSLAGVVPATVNSGAGISGIAFVPNGHHPYAPGAEGGLFYVGLEENGNVHVVDVNFNAGTARLVASFTPVAGRADLEGLDYNLETQTLFLLYDGPNLLREITPGNSFVREHQVPGVIQEGVAILPACPQAATTIVIAEDSGRVVRYGNYPISCIFQDADGDSFSSDVDCDDANPEVNPGRAEVPNNQLDDDCNADTLDLEGIIVEAEAMPALWGRNVVRLPDSVAFYTNGYAKTYQSLEAGTYNITVYARADTIPGRTANLRVIIDGTVAGNFAINSSTFVPVTLSKEFVSGGPHKVEVGFTNDYYRADPVRDVNLYVDKVVFER